MVKKCLNSISIQWDLWQPSSGRNEEAWGAPEVSFVLGEGTGDFLLPWFELGGGWQSWQGLWEGEAQLIRPCQLREALVSKACSFFLGTWKETD